MVSRGPEPPLVSLEGPGCEEFSNNFRSKKRMQKNTQKIKKRAQQVSNMTLKLMKNQSRNLTFLFFCKTLILAYHPMVLHDFLVLGGPGIDQKSIKIKTWKNTSKKNTKKNENSWFWGGPFRVLCPTYVLLMPYCCPPKSLWFRFSSTMGAFGAPGRPKTPKWHQNDSKSMPKVTKIR